MLSVASAVLGVLVVAATLLSLSRAKAWWVRVWDFPRVQLAALGLLALAGWVAADRWGEWPRVALTVALGAAVAFQAGHVWRYTRLAPREVHRTRAADEARRLTLVVCNLLQSNRRADDVLGALRACDPDLALFVEADDWWARRLDALAATHPHALREPRDNTYGMLLYSRLPLEDAAIEHLVQPDIPSMQARVRLRDGRRVWLNCVHPRPPAPGESDESLERDGELLLVGRRVRGADGPVVVCGDLNDVAWSRTTRLFQKVSGLLDPRKGRGFFGTFHARLPGLRWPLDHVFHSEDFRLVKLRRLPYVGSDHFPVYVSLSLEPQAAAEQEGPKADAEDLEEAVETAQQARAEA